MIAFLQKLEETIRVYLKETYLPPHRAKTPGWTEHDLKFFSRGVDLLSTAYTEGRRQIPKNYLNKKEYRSAYILYFLLINAAKVWHTLVQVENQFPRKGKLRILDLGAGPGTAALACSRFFGDRPIEVLGVEQNKSISKDARELWKRFCSDSKHSFYIQSVILHPNNISSLLRGKQFDLCIAANFLSELPFRDQFRLAATVLNASKTAVFIEPALQKTTHALMRLRDSLLADRRGEVIAPCLHQKNCPMLKANRRDWCHFYIEWKCPQLIRKVDAQVGNRHDYLKMAYMIFGNRPRGNDGEKIWRVVSSPLISKGKREFLLCGNNGHLEKVARLNKHKSPENSAFDGMKRGDIVSGSNNLRITVPFRQD